MSRRQLLAAGVAVGGVVLAACSDDDDGDADDPDATDAAAGTGSESSGTAVPATSSSSTGETRTVDSVRGPVEVPADPQQIVALDPYVTLQTFDELGAPLVAAGSLGADTRAFVSEEAQQLPSIGEGTELNYEAIATARPDVIVGLETYGEDVGLLDDIAPTVLIPRGSWKDNIVAVAEVVEQGDAVQGALDDLDARVDALAEAIGEAWPDGVRVSLLRVPSDGDVRTYTTYLDNLMSSEVLGRLPVTLTGDELTRNEDESYVEVAAESLEQVDADVILYYFGGGVLTNDELDTARSNLLDNPLWPVLDAVAADRAHEVDAELWFTGSNVLAAEQLLDDMERYLTAGT